MYICTPCDYIYNPVDHNNTTFTNQPTDWKCPVCGVGKELFLKINQETAEDNNPETQKKHIPLILKSEEGKVIIKIGEIEHPMTEAHYITKIQIFKNNKILKTQELSSTDSNEVITDLNFEDGLMTLAYCNVHGVWKSN